MVIRNSSEIVQPKDTVQLTVAFRDQNGTLVDTDSFPQITLVQPSGAVVLGPTSNGVMHVATGRYEFDYAVGFTGPLGVWAYTWLGFINGFRVDATFNFVVDNGNLPALNLDGYLHLGDEYPFNFSQLEINNINKLLKTLRARLNSRGKSKSKDAFGNITYVDCDIFSVDMLVTFLANSITLFNEIPHFTFFSFADTSFIDQFHDVIVEGAVIWAEASQALLERGNEMVITDNGVSFTPPSVSELLNTQFTTLVTLHQEKVKFIKNSFKPYPMGMGMFSATRGLLPIVKSLRALRERQIF